MGWCGGLNGNGPDRTTGRGRPQGFGIAGGTSVRRTSGTGIITTTKVGLAAAGEEFDGTGAILLLEEERDHWFSDVCPRIGGGFWWYTLAWWTLCEGLDGWDEEGIRTPHPLPAGSSSWLVTAGVAWGGLAGGATHVFWAWDGTTASYISVYCIGTY